jgi:hypothetical protein
LALQERLEPELEEIMTTAQNAQVTYRPGTDTDSYAVFAVFEQTLVDLLGRMGSNTLTHRTDPEALARMWKERRSLYTHLAHTSDQFWVAERNDRLIGFSRSIVRDDMRELTELFVLPGQQSGGVGRELMTRAFPLNGGERRSIIATSDSRAQTLYLKYGVYPRFPVYYFGRRPEPVNVTSDLVFAPISASPDNLDIVGALDEALLGHRRDVDHAWLIHDRQGYIYHREGEPLGYGYLGVRNGPFALLEPADFPAVLAHAESQAAANGQDRFGVEVPMVNQVVVDYLLARDFRLDTFMAVMMTDKPFGRFENYILTSPPFFM